MSRKMKIKGAAFRYAHFQIGGVVFGSVSYLISLFRTGAQAELTKHLAVVPIIVMGAAGVVYAF